jgi:hypothetical protein
VVNKSNIQSETPSIVTLTRDNWCQKWEMNTTIKLSCKHFCLVFNIICEIRHAMHVEGRVIMYYKVYEKIGEGCKLVSSSLCNFSSLLLRGRVSKQVTNGCKTAVMDVIDFICVSMDSNTGQIHDSLGSRRACACSQAGLSSQNGDLLEECTTKELCSVVRYLWAKGLNTKGYSQRNISSLRWVVFAA